MYESDLLTEVVSFRSVYVAFELDRCYIRITLKPITCSCDFDAVVMSLIYGYDFSLLFV